MQRLFHHLLRLRLRLLARRLCARAPAERRAERRGDLALEARRGGVDAGGHERRVRVAREGVQRGALEAVVARGRGRGRIRAAGRGRAGGEAREVAVEEELVRLAEVRRLD